MILNDKTIRKLISVKDAIREVEKVFRYFGMGKTQMPSKIYINLDKYNGDFRAMPAYVDPLKRCGIKWVNVHPDNKKKGLPTVMAVIILSDPATGIPLCIMDATYTTALRTGAAGGVAAKYLARRNSHVVALVGCGVQARTQLEALRTIFCIKLLKIWGKSRTEALKFKREIARTAGCKIEVTDTIRTCAENSDIIVTTTPSRWPLIKLDWLNEGVHINAIGADAKGKQELDPGILNKAKVVVDAWEQASHSGEINMPFSKKQLRKKDIYADIGEIVAKKKKGRQNEKEITVFDSTGLAIQDLAVADLVYRKAKKLRLGKYF